MNDEPRTTNTEPNVNTNGEPRTEKRELRIVATRLFVTILTAVAALYFTYWAGGAFAYAAGVTPWVSYAASLAAAVLAARSVWSRTAGTEPGFVSAVIVGALVTGGIGFCAGFFGPIVLMPGANQGPLLGIFITGPIGFVVGALGGAVWWLAERRARGK